VGGDDLAAAERYFYENFMKYIDLFAGIGGMRIPFDELGCLNVFASEIDHGACQTYEANFGHMPNGDITKIDEKDIPEHDLLLAGFPCQAFSIMGKKLGFSDTRGTMFFEVERILKYHRPQVILLENVKQLVTHDEGKTLKVILDSLEKIGYYVKYKVLNALDFGLPQKRERVVIVGFLDHKLTADFSFDFNPVTYSLNNILEPDHLVDPRLFVSEKIRNKRIEKAAHKKIDYPSIWHENKSGNVSVLDHSCAIRANASYNYLLVNGIRRFSSRELLRLQGFPDDYKIVVSYSEIRHQTGNSVPVSLIREIAKKIHFLKNGEENDKTN
jgi:DNA (cytosine-5)-methyltransferase 1